MPVLINSAHSSTAVVKLLRGLLYCVPWLFSVRRRLMMNAVITCDSEKGHVNAQSESEQKGAEALPVRGNSEDKSAVYRALGPTRQGPKRVSGYERI